jgi:filamentous hemagglutinin
LESSTLLKDGYYEVNGFRFTDFYYNKLWDSGRICPGFRAESILRGSKLIIPDPQGYEGFYKYVYDGWEMLFNPTTKIVAHMCKMRKGTP